MSKYSVKALVHAYYNPNAAWVAPTIGHSYHWDCNPECQVSPIRFTKPRMANLEIIDFVSTLSDAQAIVDAHHAEQVRALLDSLIEFTDEPSQHTTTDKP